MGTASEAQVKYLNTLLDTREVPQALAESVTAALKSGAVTVRQASAFIDSLKASPWKPRNPRPTSDRDAANAAVRDLDVSFYAIPAGLVSAQRIDLRGNDHLFVRVRNASGGRKYMSRVHGAVGSPSYTRIDPKTVVSLAALMKGRTVEFAQLWHEKSGNCGKCNATLTDLESRERGFGPDCAKMLGLV